jgi:hypothetical protein
MPGKGYRVPGVFWVFRWRWEPAEPELAGEISIASFGALLVHAAAGCNHRNGSIAPRQTFLPPHAANRRDARCRCARADRVAAVG